jgi:hypothetical protein
MPRTTRASRKPGGAHIDSPLKELPLSSKPKTRGNAKAPAAPAPAPVVAPASSSTTQPSSSAELITTSASQSPEPDESRSQSPEQAESRSTSPPTQVRYNTRRAASRSVSPSLIPIQQTTTRKGRKPAAKMTTGTRRSKAKAPSPHQGDAVSTATATATKARGKRARNNESSTHQGVDSNADEGNIARPTKRSRNYHETSTQEHVYSNPFETIEEENPTPRPNKQSTPQSALSSRQTVQAQNDAQSSYTHTGEVDDVRSTPGYTARSNKQSTPFSSRQTVAAHDYTQNSITHIDEVDRSTPRKEAAFSSQELVLAAPETESSHDDCYEHEANKPQLIPAVATPNIHTKRHNPPHPPHTVAHPPMELGQSVAAEFGLLKPLPLDPITREREIKKRWPGLPKPNPRYNNTLRRQSYNIDMDYESEHEEDVVPYTQNDPEFKRLKQNMRSLKTDYHKKLAMVAKISMSETPATRSKDNTDVSHSLRRDSIFRILTFLQRTRKQGAAPSSLRPSTNISESSTLVIPASVTEERMVLTRSDIIDSARALAQYAESNADKKLPNAEQMRALLENFHAQESAKASSAAQPTDFQLPSYEPAPVQQPSEIPDAEAEVEDNVSDTQMTDSEDSHHAATPAAESEVHEEVQEPETPAEQENPSASESTWSSWGMSKVKNFFGSPFKKSTKPQQAADAPSTNGRNETDFSFTHPSNVPQLPTTPTPSNNQPRAKVQSEHRRRDQPGRNTNSRTQQQRRRLPQTERPTRFGNQEKPPIQLRGLVSPSRIKEIQRQQDARREESSLVAEDRYGEARRKKRVSQAAYVDDEDAVTAEEELRQSRVSTGQKKRKYRAPRTPPRDPPGTFSVPYESSSESEEDFDGEDESDDEVAVDSPSTRSKLHPFTSTSYSSSHITKGHSTSSSSHTTKGHWNSDGTWNGYTGMELHDAIRIVREEQKQSGCLLPPATIWGLTPEQRKRIDELTGAPDHDTWLTGPNGYRDHARPYTGTHFQQPETVQANINEGLHPLSPRSPLISSPTTTPVSKNNNIFDTQHTMKGCCSVFEEQQTTDSYSSSNGRKSQDSPGKTFSFPEGSDSDSDGSGNEEETDSRDSGLKGHDISPAKSLTDSQSVLQPLPSKQWQQTPPPKPRPSNAQLPQQQTTAADVAKANANKFQPKKPSGLRNVIHMSPLQIEQENRIREEEMASPRSEEGYSLMSIDGPSMNAVVAADSPPLLPSEGQVEEEQRIDLLTELDMAAVDAVAAVQGFDPGMLVGF